MKSLNHFTLPILGLKVGLHQFDFQIDSSFFAHFEQQVIEKGDCQVRLYFDKRPDMMVLNFDWHGSVQTKCDRCLATIQLPINGNNQLMVKYAATEREEDEIWYIPSGKSEINLAKVIYEFVFLSLPIIKTYDCENDEQPPCDEEMLQYLLPENENEEDNDDDSSNPLWDALKDFN